VPTPSARWRRLGEAVLVCALYGALAFVLLWPLFSDPANATLDPRRVWLGGWFTMNRTGALEAITLRDMQLTLWIYAWTWHALTTDPTSLFDANIFYPAPRALAYSEHAIGKALEIGPLFAATGNAVLAYQLDVLLCFALSGAGMYALLRHMGAARAASFVGGFVYSFAPARLDMLYHSHLLSGQYFPLALLFLDRTLFTARWTDGLLFTACLLLHLLCSYYMAYMAVIALPFFLLGVACAARGGVSSRGVVATAIALAFAFGVVGLLSLPYVGVRATGALPDFGQDPASMYWLSNHPLQNYFTPALIAASEGGRLDRGFFAYLGAIPLLLAALGVAAIPRATGAFRRMLAGALCVTLASYLFSLGPTLSIGATELRLPWGWLMGWGPGFSTMRAPGRFALMVVFGWAVLAGGGFDRLLRRFRVGAAAAALVAAAFVSVIAWDYGIHRLDLKLRRSPEPAVYAELGRLPDGPVLEVPFAASLGLHATEYQVQSTRHWKPLLNGSSGYRPESERFVRFVVKRLPDEKALDLLIRMTNVRYVVVHDAYLPERMRPSWTYPPGLELLGNFDGDRLYRVFDHPEPNLVPATAACAAGTGGCAELARAIDATFPDGAPHFPRRYGGSDTPVFLRDAVR